LIERVQGQNIEENVLAEEKRSKTGERKLQKEELNNLYYSSNAVCTMT
jgi:hypothetical protein